MIKEATHKKKSNHQENPKNQGSDNMKQGWEIKKLGEVCDMYQPKTISTKEMVESGAYPVFGANGIIGRYDKYNHEEPQLLITCRGATCGSVNISEPKSWINGNAMVVRPKDHSIDLKFLEYLFRGGIDLSKTITGAAQPQITRQSLNPIEISYPKSLPEQQRIVSILDECFAAIDKAKANAEQNLKNAKELFESYLQEVFENGDWETKTIETVCDEIFAGGDAPKNNFSLEPNEKHNIPIYANAVKDRGLYGYTDFARVTRPCITIAARGSGTGHTELRNEPFLPIVRLIVCIPDTKQISTDFLKYTIDNLVIQRSGSAIPQLTVPMIKDYRIPVPTIEEQKQIIEKAETLKAETERLGNIYQKKLSDLDELKKSILQKAFSGQL
jgi:type I restriction enzyme S subunit